NFQVDVELTAGPLIGQRRLALRCDAASSLGGSIDRATEFPVISAAVEAGVKTPAARWLANGITGTAGSGYFLDWTKGTAIGRQVVRNPELEAARGLLPAQLAETLVRIHSITRDSHPDLPIGGLGTHFCGDPIESSMRGIRDMLDTLLEPHPALEMVVAWLDENRPKNTITTLVHGDFRTGNFMVTPDGLAGVLDWEFTHWGAPEEDIAWLCVRDWRFGQLKKPAGGFATRQTFYEAYEAAGGAPVDPNVVRWFEVLGNARWAVGCAHQAMRYLSGKQQDIELLAIGRRIAEMEYEAMRLIDLTPSSPLKAASPSSIGSE
ncbi:MAG: aminoglycoside phosphotransferase (APT) family kinase protein, partial [Myxococcota bacterium]